MPRHHTPKKDVASCEKPRGAASRQRTVDIRMGKPGHRHGWSPAREGTWGTETSKYPEEEKEKIDFLSSGERRGKRPNQGACSLGLWAGTKHLRL